MKLYLHETVAVGIYLVSVGFLIITGRQFHASLERFVPLTLTFFIYTYALVCSFAFIEVVFNKLKGEKKSIQLLTERLKHVHSLPFIRFVLGAILSFQIVMAAHSSIKQNMWTLTDKTYDSTLYKFDSNIHIGALPVTEIRHSTMLKPIAPFLDKLYYFYFPNMVLILSLFIFLLGCSSTRFHAFLFGQIILWGVGVWLFLIYPALGPCYYKPLYIYQTGPLTLIAFEIQRVLMEQHMVIAQFPDSFLPVPFLGISAMPSFHVAALFYYFLASFWVPKWWARLYCGLFFVLIYIGSLYTGWHYLLDGVAGMVWATLVYLFTRLCYQHYKPGGRDSFILHG